MKQILLFLICMTIVSCIDKTKSPDTSIISLNEISGEKNVNDLFDSFEYICLETSEESFFGTINKLRLYKDKFYILDKVGTKKIYVFNHDGSFSHTIGRVGNGPGECINVEDFTIDKEKEQVVLLTYPSTAYVYDLQGNFCNSKKLGESLFWNICSYKNGFVCSTNHQTYTEGENAFLLFFFDKDFNFQDKLLPVLSHQIAVPPFVSNPLINSGNNIVYFDNFTATFHIIHTDGDRKLHSIILDLESKMPTEVFGSSQSFFAKQNEYSYVLEAFHEKDELWAFWGKKGKLCSLIANMKTGEKKVNYFTGKFPNIQYYQDGIFYSSIEPNEVMEGGNNPFSSIGDTKILVNENSNPVIVKFKAKTY